MNESDSLDEQRAALLRAKASAEAGDPIGMMTAFSESFMLDRLSDLLEARWTSTPLDSDTAQYFVGEAVDAFYQEVRNGRKVLDVAAFVFKVADRKASANHADRLRERSVDPEFLGRTVIDSHQDHSASLSGSSEPPREQKRLMALSIARSKLSQLGQQNVQAVMTYILDAIEAGREDVPSREVADALGLSYETTKKSLQRGLQKLTKIVRESGLTDRTLNIPEFLDDEDDPQEQA